MAMARMGGGGATRTREWGGGVDCVRFLQRFYFYQDDVRSNVICVTNHIVRFQTLK